MDRERQVTVMKNMLTLVQRLHKTNLIIEYLRYNNVLSVDDCPYESDLFNQNKKLLLLILAKDNNEIFDMFYNAILMLQPNMSWFLYTPKHVTEIPSQ